MQRSFKIKAPEEFQIKIDNVRYTAYVDMLTAYDTHDKKVLWQKRLFLQPKIKGNLESDVQLIYVKKLKHDTQNKKLFLFLNKHRLICFDIKLDKISDDFFISSFEGRSIQEFLNTNFFATNKHQLTFHHEPPLKLQSISADFNSFNISIYPDFEEGKLPRFVKDGKFTIDMFKNYKISNIEIKYRE